MKRAILICWTVILFATSAMADHNAFQLDAFVLGLPDGWETHISRAPDYWRNRYGVPELFRLNLELPTVQFEYEFYGRKVTHPSLLLFFFAPLTEKQYGDLQKVEAEHRTSTQPIPPMLLLAKTENYWVFTSQQPDRFRHPTEEEIYHYVKGFLSGNRKE